MWENASFGPWLYFKHVLPRLGPALGWCPEVSVSKTTGKVEQGEAGEIVVWDAHFDWKRRSGCFWAEVSFRKCQGRRKKKDELSKIPTSSDPKESVQLPFNFPGEPLRWWKLWVPFARTKPRAWNVSRRLFFLFNGVLHVLSRFPLPRS